MANGQDTGAHSGRQGGRDSHATRKAGKLAPSGDMGTTDINTLVKTANPTPAGGAAPMGTTKVFQAPTSQRGYSGHAAYAVPTESMPGIKDHYKDLRMGTNNSGNNPENQTMSRQDARSVSMTKSKGTMIQDASGKPTTNNLGVSY